MTAKRRLSAIKAWVGLAIALLWALAGCGGEPQSAHQLADVLDADLADARDPDTTRASGRAPYMPELAGLCAGAPADFFGQLAWVYDQTVWLSPNTSDASVEDTAPRPILGLSATASARSPVVLGDVPWAGSSTFALAVVDQNTSTLNFLDYQGNRTATIERPNARAMQPLAGGSTLVWPLHDLAADGGRVLWVDLVDRTVAFELDILAVPTTPAVLFGPGLQSGGGSHWVVGTDTGLVMVADRWLSRRLDALPINPRLIPDQPVIVGRLALDSPTAHLLVLGDHLAVTRQLAGSWVVELYRVELTPPDNFTFVPVGPPALLPGPPTAHPVARTCGPTVTDKDRGLCPRDEVATVVVGGEGWLFAYHLATGTSTSLSDAALVWTGLAVGDGGWVAGGGSHWLPKPTQPERDALPGWQLWALHPTEPDRQLAAFTHDPATGDAPSTCVPSPLWDTDGTIAVPIAGATGAPLVVRSRMPAAAGHPGLAAGFPRPHGTNQNSARLMAAPPACSDGIVRSLDTLERPGSEITGFAHGAGRSAIFGSAAGTAFVQWLPGPYNPPIEFLIEDALVVDRLVVTSDSGGLAMVFRDRSGASLLEVREAFEALVQRNPIDNDGRPLLGLVAGAPGPSGARFVTASWPSELQVLEVGTGTIAAAAFDDSDSGPTALKLLPDRAPLPPDAVPGGAVMVVSSELGLTIRRVDGALTELAFTRNTDMGLPIVITATIDGQGHVRLITQDADAISGPPATFWHYDADLALVRSIPLLHAGPMATDPSGDSLVSSTIGLYRIGRGGNVGLPHQPNPDAFPIEDAMFTDGTEFVAGWSSVTQVPSVVWGRVDPLGFATCFSAGACLGRDANACDGEDLCVANGCEPATGLCVSEALSDCR